MKSFLIIMVLFFVTYIPLSFFITKDLKKIVGPNLAIYTALVTLAGTYLPNVPLYLLAVVVIFLATVRSRIEAVGRYILLAAIVPQLQWEIGAAGHYFGVIDSAGALGLSAYIATKFYPKAAAGGGHRGWTTEDWLVLVTFLITAIGGAGFGKMDDTLRNWLFQFLMIVLPYMIFRSSLKTISDYRLAVACFGIASLFLAVFAIYEAKMDVDIFDNITKHLTGIYLKPVNMRGGYRRATATMAGPLALACFMTVGLFSLACSRDFFKSKLGYYGSLIVALFGLLASQSRGSLLAVFGSAIVLSLALRKWGTAAAASAVAILAWPAAQVLASVSPLVASFIGGGVTTANGKYFDYRNELLERGLQVAAQHPFTGMRNAQVLDALADITQGEGFVDLVNVYLVFLLISGIVGLLPFLGLTINSVAKGSFGFKRVNDPALLRARGFAIAALSVVLIQFSFVSFIDRIPMMFVLTLCGIRLVVIERQARRKPADALVVVRQTPTTKVAVLPQMPLGA